MNFRQIAVFFAIILVGCKGVSTNNGSGHEEVWAQMPFYGELRFQVMSEGDETAVPDATLQVSGLLIHEMVMMGRVSSVQDGRIVIHQLQRGITYTGDGPTPPSFTFDAPNYQSRTYSMADLVADTAYDPYKNDNLPTTLFKYGSDQEKELPMYEFTIYLIPDEN